MTNKQIADIADALIAHTRSIAILIERIEQLEQITNAHNKRLNALEATTYLNRK